MSGNELNMRMIDQKERLEDHTKLKRCPFCGTKAYEIAHGRVVRGGTDNTYEIKCNSALCGISIKEEDRATVRKKWNKRA